MDIDSESIEAWLPQTRSYPVARIDESLCIGCTRCIQACPVDAIVGAAKLMHTVIGVECIGCRQCLPPCPVDCIELVPARQDWTPARARQAHARHRARNHRLQQSRREHRQPSPSMATEDIRKAVIAAAVARVRAKRAAHRHDTR